MSEKEKFETNKKQKYITIDQLTDLDPQSGFTERKATGAKGVSYANLSKEELAKISKLEKRSSRLPSYISLGVVASLVALLVML